MLLVAAGGFAMGSPVDDLVAGDDELHHEVTLTGAFWLQTHEVTQGEWTERFASNPASFPACGPGCPVETVTWWEAAAFANARSQAAELESCYLLSGCAGVPGSGMTCADVLVRGADRSPYNCQGYRLPSEAEWEYAARAGTTTATQLGELRLPAQCEAQPNLDPIGWFCGNSEAAYDGCEELPAAEICAGTHPAAAREANPWGLYDMFGNVGEWTGDLYGPYAVSADDPLGASEGDGRVWRGGAWRSVAALVRSAARGWAPAEEASNAIGLRIARSQGVLGHACDDDGDCRPTFRCVMTGDDESTCQLAGEGADCESDSECPERHCVDRGCHDGSAWDPCNDDEDCPLAGFCDEETGRCIPDDLVRIEAGTFTMGSGIASNEVLHEVTLTRPFYIQATETTQRQWTRLFDDNPAWLDHCGLECPVEWVYWWETLAYANARSEAEGLAPCFVLEGCERWPGAGLQCTGFSVTAPEGNPYDCEGYRLPTEAEWEYAAGAGTTTDTYLGDLDEPTNECGPQPSLEPIAWYCHNSAVEYPNCDDITGRGVPACAGTHPVAMLAPNVWGLYDMLGNVAEWTWDSRQDVLVDETDPRGPPPSSRRVIRGGSWLQNPDVSRTAERGTSLLSHRDPSLGFRVVRTAR